MCSSPLKLRDRTVSCGQCIECLVKRSQQWAFRLEQEAQTATSGMFITLTYNDENAIWLDGPNGELLTTLDKSEFQKFMKRLRKMQGKPSQDYRKKIRYFACGEYGSKGNRAHYHAIIFNANEHVRKNIDKLWPKGWIKIGDVNPKTIRYVTNYMLLKDQNLIEGQQKPFTLMSKKPILGANYVANNYMHHHETKSYKLKIAGGYQRNLYKTYEERVFTKDELFDVRFNKRQEQDQFTREQIKEASKINPWNPKKVIDEEYQHRQRSIRQKAIKSLKNRTL